MYIAILRSTTKLPPQNCDNTGFLKKYRTILECTTLLSTTHGSFYTETATPLVFKAPGLGFGTTYATDKYPLNLTE